MLSTAGVEYDARHLWDGCSEAVGPPGLFGFRCANRWLRHRQRAAATPWLGAPVGPGTGLALFWQTVSARGAGTVPELRRRLLVPAYLSAAYLNAALLRIF